MLWKELLNSGVVMIQRAKITDGPDIQKLINGHAKEGKMLQRSILEIYERIRDFFVYRRNGRVVGAASLAICWEDLAEIRSVAVKNSDSGKGVGKKLIEACEEEARRLGIKKVFVLTYIPEYFKKFGYKTVSRAKLPHKIWKDCINCPKFPDCGEVPMVKTLR
jgi:amino-acid N-acetyltransferase